MFYEQNVSAREPSSAIYNEKLEKCKAYLYMTGDRGLDDGT